MVEIFPLPKHTTPPEKLKRKSKFVDVVDKRKIQPRDLHQRS